MGVENERQRESDIIKIERGANGSERQSTLFEAPALPASGMQQKEREHEHEEKVAKGKMGLGDKKATEQKNTSERGSWGLLLVLLLIAP